MMGLAGPDAGSGGRYTRVAMWLHWLIAALIVGNLLLGFFHDGFPRESRRAVMTIHKSIGLAVLLLSLARLAWRLGHRPPSFDAAMKRWEVLLAHAVHMLFYVMMIGVPLSGWLLSSTGGRTTDFFFLVSVPALPVSQSDESHEFWEESHELLAFATIGLLLLHVAGALKHYLEGHRQLVGRMAPWLGSRA